MWSSRKILLFIFVLYFLIGISSNAKVSTNIIAFKSILMAMTLYTFSFFLILLNNKKQ